MRDKNYYIITSRKFSRIDPVLPDIVRNNIANNLPIVLLWGGSKESLEHKADNADKKSIDFLQRIHQKLGEIEIKILYCDLHHIIANGIDKDESTTYFDSLRLLIDGRIKIDRLSYVMKTLGAIQNPVYESEAQRLLEDKMFREEIYRKSRKHSRRTELLVSEKGEQYVSYEIFFLSQIYHYSLDITFASFSDPIIQRPIAEVAGVPMLFLNSSEGHHECPWYVREPFKEI